MESGIKSLLAIKPSEIKDNPIEMFHKDWAVIAAGSPDDFNEMTVSWGALGASWVNRNRLPLYLSARTVTPISILKATIHSLSTSSPRSLRRLRLTSVHTQAGTVIR